MVKVTKMREGSNLGEVSNRRYLSLKLGVLAKDFAVSLSSVE